MTSCAACVHGGAACCVVETANGPVFLIQRLHHLARGADVLRNLRAKQMMLREDFSGSKDVMMVGFDCQLSRIWNLRGGAKLLGTPKI